MIQMLISASKFSAMENIFYGIWYCCLAMLKISPPLALPLHASDSAHPSLFIFLFG